MKWLERFTLPDTLPLWGMVHRCNGWAFVTDSRSMLAVGSLVRRLRGRSGNVAWIGRSGV